jgi:hypothetical protein
MPMPGPSVDLLKAIHDAANILLAKHAQYRPLLDDPPRMLDGAYIVASPEMIQALGRLEILLNPGPGEG